MSLARIRYTEIGSFELSITDMSDGSLAGYAARASDHHGHWAVWSYSDYDGYAFLGHAESLALAADVVVNGEHAATARHDSQRINWGHWEPYRPVQ